VSVSVSVPVSVSVLLAARLGRLQEHPACPR